MVFADHPNIGGHMKNNETEITAASKYANSGTIQSKVQQETETVRCKQLCILVTALLLIQRV